MKSKKIIIGITIGVIAVAGVFAVRGVINHKNSTESSTEVQTANDKDKEGLETTPNGKIAQEDSTGREDSTERKDSTGKDDSIAKSDSIAKTDATGKADSTEKTDSSAGTNSEQQVTPTEPSPSKQGEEPATAPDVSVTPSGKDKLGKDGKEIVAVRSIEELIENLQSNREIRLLPGDYTYSKTNQDVCLEQLSNVTLRGIPYQSSVYIPLYVGFQIHNCNNIELINLDIGYSNDEMQDYYEAFAIVGSENIKVSSCKIRSSSLYFGDLFASDYKLNENVVFKDSVLAGKADTCYIYANLPGGFPTPNSYEIDLGTSDWGFSNNITGIYYANSFLENRAVTFINTYDGYDGLAEKKEFTGLQDRLNVTFPDSEVFLSYEESELIININNKNKEDEKKINNDILPKLYSMREEIYANAEKVYIAVWNYEWWFPSLERLYLLEKNNPIEKQICNIHDRGDDIVYVESVFIPSDNVTDTYHLVPRRIFEYQNPERYNFSVVESFTGMGDYVYYDTNLVTCTKIDTNESYVCCKEGFYEIQQCTESDKKAYYKAVYDYLSKNSVKIDNPRYWNYEEYADEELILNLKDAESPENIAKPEEVLNKEIFVPVKRVDQADKLYVIFLFVQDNGEVDYGEPECTYNFKIAQIDKSGKVIEVNPLTIKPSRKFIFCDSKDWLK